MYILHSQPRWTGSGSSSSSQPPTNNNPHPSAGPRASTSSNIRSQPVQLLSHGINRHQAIGGHKTTTRIAHNWSQGKIDKGGVLDIYVRLGNKFNAASLAFTKEGINMR
ncbi:hypothetical protein PSTT_04498 [Puccinia striiformis]|uniref:Aip3p/Bud6 N-terminal domain-containing protein n=1 Tax=Puccinia striiformis TaxID=27350 RepID=A0A2S4VSK1_9BASI|nr:hypothetical protein PSTT_04498 [Puccinia striiformis]